MPRITFKETITKEIEIPLDQLFSIIDRLSSEDKKKLKDRLETQPIELKPFRKAPLDSVIADFASLDVYEDEFLKELEKGLKESSAYRKD